MGFWPYNTYYGFILHFIGFYDSDINTHSIPSCNSIFHNEFSESKKKWEIDCFFKRSFGNFPWTSHDRRYFLYSN